MKKLLLITLAILSAWGWHTLQRARLGAQSAEVARLEAEIQVATGMKVLMLEQTARVESVLAERTEALASLLASNAAASAGQRVITSSPSLDPKQRFPGDSERFWNSKAEETWLPKEYLAKLGVEAFSYVDAATRSRRQPSSREQRWLADADAYADGYNVNRTAATILSINESELKAVQAALTDAARRQRQIELDRVEAGGVIPERVKGIVTEGITFTVPSFAGEGRVIRDAFVEAVQQALGNQRADLFLQMAEPTLRTDFADFGQAPRTITFGVSMRGSLTNHTVVETGVSRYFRHYGSSVERPDLPAGWRHLIEFSGPWGAPALRR